MADISPLMVKELRDKTGAGMGDCKKALVDSNGDMKEAVEILRKKGAASAAKRTDRSAKEGLIIAITDEKGNTASVVEVNCETDFVARNAEFDKYAKTVANAIQVNNPGSIEELMLLSTGDDTIQGLHNEILAKFSENIQVRRFEKMTTDGYISHYIHAGSKLAVLIEVSASNLSAKAQSLVHDIAMQIAAMNPTFVDRSQVTTETIDKEIEIYKQLAIDSGKSEDIATRIAQGKLDKFYQEQCLVEQTFVKDPNKTVSDVIKEIQTDSGSEIKIRRFIRYYLGED